MSSWTSNTVTLNYTNSTTSDTKAFTVAHAEDDSFQIIGTEKKRLITWGLRENILGYRRIITVRFHPLTDAERAFLYWFAMADHQEVVVNSNTYTVRLQNTDTNLSLLDGWYYGQVIEWELIEETWTAKADPGLGSNTYSVNYRSNVAFNHAYQYGTAVCLAMSYTSWEARYFSVRNANAFNLNIERKDWEYVDKNFGRKTLGRRIGFDIDFGAMGWQTQAQLQDDRDFIRNFVLAPSKYIYVSGGYQGAVVNDFDEVRYSINNTIFDKSTRLRFIETDISDVVPTQILSGSHDFILDHDVLDGGSLLG